MFIRFYIISDTVLFFNEKKPRFRMTFPSDIFYFKEV
nr:MAG TPA: hypothetical protein [Caudoviricetes sp.]